MKVPGSRQSFPEVLWCGDTHQWCIYIYIQIHTHTHIYIYYIPLKVGALALLIVSGADQSSKQRMGRSQEARGTSQRHLLLESCCDWVMASSLCFNVTSNSQFHPTTTRV